MEEGLGMMSKELWLASNGVRNLRMFEGKRRICLKVDFGQPMILGSD